MAINNCAAPANLLTIDLEDWYQLTGDILEGGGRPRPADLQRQMDRLLELLASHECRATFFCLGKSLVHLPELVRQVADEGHEIGTHGWEHDRVYRMGLDVFRDDLRRSMDWLGDICGRQICGHRAAVFSVAPEQLEGFYDVCFESGLLYDSSVFPIRGRRYGIPHAPLTPHVVRDDGTRQLFELPLATIQWLGRRWPVAGGGWWRVMPTRLIQAAVSRCHRAGRTATTYFHPYEFDSQRLQTHLAAGRSWRSTVWDFKQNLGRASVFRKLDSLLSTYHFVAVEDYLRGKNCPTH